MAAVKFPYSQVHVHDGIIFAARAGRIESFNLHTDQHLSTWMHPDAERFIDYVKRPSNDIAEDVPATEPPSKRQKISEDSEGQANPSGAEEKPQGEEQIGSPGEKLPKQAKPKQVDRPVIIQLIGTTDGKHIVAVSGHDKAIWVFDHTGSGQLRQLSKRTMPKRPSTIALGPGAQIISADKFGDVYALPLIPDESWTPAPAATRWKPAKPMTKTAASELTVHSKKNLITLREQQRMIERKQQQLESEQPAKLKEPKTEIPDFELTLLLGHVSTVTALALGENKGRPVIITGDRDEHVRVSRYIPQAHVIEGFCLGHREFVSSLVVPRTRGEVLVTGGGDEDLFIWNWQTGGLLSKVNILSLAQEVMPEATKVAVSKLVTFDYTSEADNSLHTCILAICEGIKAIFCWYLTEANELKFPSIIQVPGNPLNLTLTQSGTASLPTLVVGLDTSEGTQGAKGESLNVYELVKNKGKIAVGVLKPIVKEESVDSDADIDASVEEIKRTLYGFENLRKARVDSLAEAEGVGSDAGLGEGGGEEVAEDNE